MFLKILGHLKLLLSFNELVEMIFQEAWKTLKCLQEENEFTLTGNKILGGQVAVLLEGLASGLTSASIDTSSQIISVEFDPEISPKEREQLYETFKRIDQCQQQLNMFQGMITVTEKIPFI